MVFAIVASLNDGDQVVDKLAEGLSRSIKRPNATKMFQEAHAAGSAVANFLESNEIVVDELVNRLRASPPTVIVTCARGSSDHAATYAKYLFETFLGIPVSSSALSIASIYEAPVAGKHALCIAISQSGRSPDLLAAVQAHADAGSLVVALVNDEGSPLAALADVTLPLRAGPEHAVAATKSYITSLAGIAFLTARWVGDAELEEALRRLPEELPKAFAFDWSYLVDQLEGAGSLFTLGRGYSLGIAQEAALKLKETCGLHAEAFSAAEVRHGPMAIVGEQFSILGFATSDAAGEAVCAVAKVLASRGAHVAISDPAKRDGLALLPSMRTHPAVEPILMIQSFYRMVNELSLRRGLDPDEPPHLSKVTQTL